MQTRASAAYHEAGHAVIATRYGHSTGSLTIEPDDERGINGSAMTESEWADGSKDREQIVVLYAGYAAQKKFDPTADPGGSSLDNERASELLRNNPEFTEGELRDEARQLVDNNWEQIAAVATALLEFTTLDEDWDIIVDYTDDGKDWRESYGELLRLKSNC